ncbi:MAG TPA: TonB-dependent receptor [Pyrinomonadaceae bacterium]
MYYKTIGVFLFVVTFSLAAFGQTNRVEGVVQDSAGQPVAGSVVTLRHKTSRAERTSTTDSTGRFSFDMPSADSYELVANARGFGSVTRDLGPGETSVSLTLEPQPIKEQVTVTATRTEVVTTETTVPVSVVDRESIERQGVNTVGDIFRTLPGTSTTNEGAFQVRPRIRGLESNRVLVLVDGERLNNSRTSTGQSGIELGLVDLSQVETVEVARGSGSVLYGTDALAGTINIITRDTPARRDKGFRLGAVLDTFYSSNENGRRGNLAVNGSSKYFAFRVAQSLERFDNYFTGEPSPIDVARLRADDLQITDEGEVLNSQSHAGNSQATLRFFFNDTNTLKLNYERRRGANIGSAGLTGPNTGIPGLAGVFNAYFPFNNRDRFNVRYDVAALTDNLQRITVKAFYQTQYRNFTNSVTVPPVLPFFPGVYQFSETVTDTKTTGFDLQSDWVFGRHNVIAGASYFNDDNSDRRFIISSTTPFSSNRTIRHGRSVPNASLSNIGLFAQDEFRVTGRLKLVGGIRFDRFKTVSEQTENFAVDPRLPVSDVELLGLTGLNAGLDVNNTALTGDFGAIYRLTRNVNLSARIGRSFRTPNISERFFTDTPSAEGYQVGNPALVPETGINFDTSVKISTNRFRASATYFNNYYKNFLTTVAACDESVVPCRPIVLVNPAPRPGTQVYQVRNIRTARIQGFEGELEMPFKISLGYLTPYGNFSYLRGDDVDQDQPLDFISPFRTNAGFRWQNFGKNYYFDYNVRIVGKQNRLSSAYLIPVNDGPEPGFVTHNIGGGYYLRRERFNFNINLGVSNLLDRYYSEQFTFAPARGRSLTIGTTIEIK